MKYNSLCKSALAVAALCTAFGTIVPFSNTYIEAQETDLSTEQKNGTVGLTQEKDNYPPIMSVCQCLWFIILDAPVMVAAA